MQALSGEPWLRMGADVLRAAVPMGWTSDSPGAARAVGGLRRGVRALADAGNDVVVDVVLRERAWLDDWAAVLHGVTAWLIGVRCPAAVVRDRLRRRGDLTSCDGLDHLTVVHSHTDYDLEVDTSLATPDHCARRILDHIAAHPPRVLRRLAP
jgi:chloramphenicol 3-O phosphotransferase